MKSKVPGTHILEVEVTNISKHGFWILLGEEEIFLPFRDFPWFETSPVSAILHLEMLGPEHLYWPDLDIDLTVESVRHPEKYPLVSRLMPNE
ncbi:MAG: DUF2442 domain-containing protein [Syntrophobacteraceae bacterium]|jgi:hypothetical protein|nr:DUF2442 domain-containing protein [Syntrophobacteraceae bacterium]